MTVRSALRLAVAVLVASLVVRVAPRAWQTEPQTPVVYTAVVDAIIHPVSAEFIARTIDEADQADASLVVSVADQHTPSAPEYGRWEWSATQGSLVWSWGDPPGAGRKFTYKTLQLNFWRPGDEIQQNEREIRFGVAPDRAALYESGEGVAYRWVYR